MSSGDEEDATSAAMAAMMGFSSFGTQERPSKKRRFNPRADAATTEDQNGTGTGTGRRAPAGTGANSAPLGPPRHSSNLPLHPTPRDTGASNADEIALDDDVDDEDSDGDQRQPQYIDTSRPVGHEEPVDPEEEAQFQEQIDAIVAAGNATYGSVARRPSLSSSAPGLVGGAAPTGGPGGPSRARGGRGRHHSRGGHRAGPQGEWWIDYYDPSSNENPWTRLEGQLGLQAQGSWLARGERVG